MFNALQGDKRLLFLDPAAKRRVDIFLDVFEMCHKFDFHNRLELDKWTLTPSDLLVTKLQVVEINEKDYKDTIALILDHQIGDKDDLETINGRYIASLCENEWGIYKTFTRNLKWLSDSLEKYLDDTEQVKLVRSKINNLLDRIERQPKTLRWRMRASVGEKVTWYELPGKV